MKKQFTCIVCPNGCEIEAEVENGQVISVTGHTCPRGEQYVLSLIHISEPRD